MGRVIVKIKEFYLEWSSVVDAPVTFGMNLDELKAYIKNEYGEQGMRELPARLKRVEKNGTSSIDGYFAEDIMSINRAGPNEKRLTVDEIYTAYCLRQPIRNGWTPPT